MADEPQPEAAQNEAQVPNAVLVLRSIDEEGKTQVALQRLGDIASTEVPTLLELGLKAARQQLGLNE